MLGRSVQAQTDEFEAAVQSVRSAVLHVSNDGDGESVRRMVLWMSDIASQLVECSEDLQRRECAHAAVSLIASELFTEDWQMENVSIMTELLQRAVFDQDIVETMCDILRLAAGNAPMDCTQSLMDVAAKLGEDLGEEAAADALRAADGYELAEWWLGSRVRTYSARDFASSIAGSVSNEEPTWVCTPPPVREWQADEVAEWLLSVDPMYAEFEGSFRENVRSGPELLALDSGALRELGIRRIGARARLLSAVAELHPPARPVAPSPPASPTRAPTKLSSKEAVQLAAFEDDCAVLRALSRMSSFKTSTKEATALLHRAMRLMPVLSGLFADVALGAQTRRLVERAVSETRGALEACLVRNFRKPFASREKLMAAQTLLDEAMHDIMGEFLDAVVSIDVP